MSNEIKAVCCLCHNLCNENAPVLTMGPYGTPRLLCSSCSDDLDTVTTDRDPERIKEAMERIGKRLSEKNPDELSLETVNDILFEASERAKQIERGEYDFALDETAEEGELLDIPDEQKESEEDKALDEKEAVKMAKFDKILNWVFLAVVILIVGFFIFNLVRGMLG